LDKRILFILIVSVESLTIAGSIGYFVGVVYIPEYLALFTSIATAMYTILAEPKKRTEPFLRITPTLKRHGTIAIGNYSSPETVGLDIWIENIGYSIAKGIEVKCQIVPNGSIPLKNKEGFVHPLLAPKETVKYQAVESADSNKLLSQQLTVEVAYSNEDDKRQKPIKKHWPMKELEDRKREVKAS